MDRNEDLVQRYLADLQLKLWYRKEGYYFYMASAYGSDAIPIDSAVLCSQGRFRNWCMDRTGKIPFTVDREIFELAMNVALEKAEEIKKKA